jgi:hypothetical protein
MTRCGRVFLVAPFLPRFRRERGLLRHPENVAIIPKNRGPLIAFLRNFRHAKYKRHHWFWQFAAIWVGTLGVEIASKIQPQARLVPAVR